MPTEVVATRIKWGLLALAVGSLLFIPAFLLRGGPVDPSVDPQGFAEQVASAGYTLSSLVLYGVTVLLLVGVVALYAYLMTTGAERWAFAALVASVVSIPSIAVGAGQDAVVSFAGELYLEGQQGFLERLIDAPLTLSDVVFGVVFNRLGNVVSFVLFAVAIWRSGVLPQGAAILWVAATVLFSASVLGVWVQVLAPALWTVGNAWIAWTVWRQPDAAVVGAEARPRGQ